MRFFLASRLVLGALAAGALALVAPGPPLVALLVLDAALVLAVAFDVASAPRALELTIARELPAVVTIGKEAVVALRMRNPASRALNVRVHDASPPSLGRDPVRQSLSIPPGVWARVEARLAPARRGAFELGPVTVRTLGRLGLAGRQERVSPPGRLKVYPALPSRAAVELRLERARLLQTGERSSTVRGGGTDFDSVREYHPDDEFRRINWRATARARKPISNVYREERNQQVMLLLDASRLMAANIASVSRFEHAIDAAVAVAELAARVGDHVGMVAFGADVLAAVAPKGTSAQPRRILDALFALEPSLDAPNYPRAFGSFLGRHRRRALLVLLTEIVDVASLESLFGALPALVRRHLVIVGSARDPELERLAAAIPSSSPEAYAKAAAAGALAARERAAARLRRMGAGVVDRPPSELAGAVADEYLRIKAYGRL